MNQLPSFYTRRRFLNTVALGAAAFTVRGAFAEQLMLTPPQTEGPFYPNKMPLDTDNDLLIINDGITPGVGEITHVTGRILSETGAPIRNAIVEIWQTDNNGVYLHTSSPRRDEWDANFQGFGRFLTGSTGEYYFRTIKPTPYSAGSVVRTRHIHYAVYVKGRDKYTTQCYVKGEPLNERDGVLNGIKDLKARESVIVDFAPLEGSKIGELTANFDIILGHTPEA